MKIEELKIKTDDELKAYLLKIRKDLFNIRFQIVNGQIQNTASIKGMKKSIARVKGILTERIKCR